mgnify:CR=1 FL=1
MTPTQTDSVPTIRLICGDALECLRTLPAESVNCVMTSPPYWGLRDYGVGGQIGLEQTPEEYVARLVEVFREVRRVLMADGSCWLNLGDSYNAHPGQRKITDKAGPKQASNTASPGAPSRSVESLKPKDLIGIPWRVAFALQADGWWLRQDIIWAKPNPMPESVRDRCTRSHEYIFLLTKSAKYWYDADAISESLATDPKENYPARARITGRGTQGVATARGNDRDKSGGFPPQSNQRRNKRSVWTITPKPLKEAHFATFPPELPELCIKAGCPLSGTVLDPFCGAGTTAVVARSLGRDFIGIELNPEYIEIAKRRLA